MGERRTLLSALRSDPRYTDVSHYARQLSAYLHCGGRECVYTLTLEVLLANPVVKLQRLYAWLGVDASFQPPTLGAPDNVLANVIEQVRGFGLLDRLRRTATYRRAWPWLPQWLCRVGAHLAARPVRPGNVDASQPRRLRAPTRRLIAGS